MGNSYISKPRIGIVGGLAALIGLAATNLVGRETAIGTVEGKDNNTPATQQETPKIDQTLVEKIELAKATQTKVIAAVHDSVDLTTKEGVEKSKKTVEAVGKKTTYNENGINLNNDSMKYISNSGVLGGDGYVGATYTTHTAFKWTAETGHITYTITSGKEPGKSYQIHIMHNKKLDDGSISDVIYDVLKDKDGKEETSKPTPLLNKTKEDDKENKSDSHYLSIGYLDKTRVHFDKNYMGEEFVRSIVRYTYPNISRANQTLTITAEGASIAYFGVDKADTTQKEAAVPAK